MKDSISTCVSSGITFIISNWYFGGDREENQEALIDEIEDFINCVSSFIAVENSTVEWKQEGIQPMRIDVYLDVAGESEKRHLTFNSNVEQGITTY